MSVAFVYHSDLGRSPEQGGYDFGPNHPLRIERLGLAVKSMEQYGLLSHPDIVKIEAQPVDEAALLSFHRPEYLEVLKRASRGEKIDHPELYGLDLSDNPVSLGVWDWFCLVTGGSLAAARYVADGLEQGLTETALAISGGLHHAKPGQAYGFCFLNDCVVAINHLIERGLRVAYVDIDAHHGDGVQDAYYQTDQVLTVSFHQSGRTLFPGTGRVVDNGLAAGRGFSVNMPFKPYSDDEVYIWAFDQIVPKVIDGFNPDVVVTQLGVDALHSDPLTDMYCTDRMIAHATRYFKSMERPWVALGGGGYDVVNVVRCWTQVLAIMLGVDMDNDPKDESDRLPQDILAALAKYRPESDRMHDEERLVVGPTKRDIWNHVRLRVAQIEDTVFPALRIQR